MILHDALDRALGRVASDQAALLDAPGGTVQYHPEAGPGPHDSLYLFDRFLDQIKAVGEWVDHKRFTRNPGRTFMVDPLVDQSTH